MMADENPLGPNPSPNPSPDPRMFAPRTDVPMLVQGSIQFDGEGYPVCVATIMRPNDTTVIVCAPKDMVKFGEQFVELGLKGKKTLARPTNGGLVL